MQCVYPNNVMQEIIQFLLCGFVCRSKSQPYTGVVSLFYRDCDVQPAAMRTVTKCVELVLDKVVQRSHHTV